MLTVGDLFSGIGGFSLGLERAGMRTAWFAETDPYASAVLRKHWPEVPNHGDVRLIRGESVERPDVICGGFPCQDISDAGLRVGIEGSRSALWKEFARIVGELRPRYVIVENVAALLGRGFEVVLGDLAALGFDSEWHCIPASAVGAPQHRDRVFVVSYPKGSQEGSALAHYCCCETNSGWALPASPPGGFIGLHGWGDWSAEPKIRRVVDGVSANVDADSVLGNAIVPQIAEIIGRAIVNQETA